MKSQGSAIRVVLVALGAFLSFAVAKPACAGSYASDRVLTGELVVTNAARNQFRLVEHSGSFTAPAGIAVTDFDGKPVRVEFGSDGRPVQISQMAIDYAPITHGFEVVSGEFVVRDPVTRTFGISGDNRTYSAPPGMDPGLYAGQMVELRLDERGQVMSINRIARSADAPLSAREGICAFGDATVASGTSICRGGTMIRCAGGAWVNTSRPCP